MPNETLAAQFRALHRVGEPLTLFNIWDAGSAKIVEEAGARALATGSWAVAAARGYSDGEKMARSDMIDLVRELSGATGLPLTVDLESGYGDVSDVAETISLAIGAGAIGCNLEDSYPADGSLRPVSEAAERLATARAAADTLLPSFFLNARCDVFFQAPETEHNSKMVAALLERAAAYAAAGADGIFAPGLTDVALIREIANAVPLPLNIMRLNDTVPLREFADAGVARISHGPYPYLAAMEALKAAVRG